MEWDLEKIHAYLEPIATELAKSGMTITWDPSQTYKEFSRYSIKYGDQNFGSIRLSYGSEPDNMHADICFSTKIIMNTMSSFTKSSLRNDCTIKLTNDRTYGEQDWKKVTDWLTLLARQYKTVLVKKRKFEADVDFE